MNAAEVLSRLQAAGVTITRRGKTLRLEPREAVPQGLLDEVKACKPDLIRLLGRDQTPPPQWKRCKQCGLSSLTTEDQRLAIASIVETGCIAVLIDEDGNLYRCHLDEVEPPEDLASLPRFVLKRAPRNQPDGL